MFSRGILTLYLTCGLPPWFLDRPVPKMVAYSFLLARNLIVRFMNSVYFKPSNSNVGKFLKFFLNKSRTKNA